MSALARLLAAFRIRTRRVGGMRWLYVGRWTISLSRRRDGPDPPKPAAGRKRAGKATAPTPLWVVTPEPDAPPVETVPDAGGGNPRGNKA